MPSAPTASLPLRASHADRGAQRRELYFFTLYRVFQAAVIIFLVHSPFADALAEPIYPYVGRAAALSYGVLALALWLAATRSQRALSTQVSIGTSCDIAATLLVKAALDGPEAGLALLLLVNIGAAALLLPLRWGLLLACTAAVGTVLEFLLTLDSRSSMPGGVAETSMFAITYLSTAALCYTLGKQLRESEALAERRGEQVSNLAQVNELVIRRLASGVIVVDAQGKVKLINEAAWHLFGEPSPGEHDLAALSPALAERLRRWKQRPIDDPSPISGGAEQTDYLPRFSRLGGADGLVLIFLDDTSLLSRRAQQLTLSALGRLSASIAHEIRNPLGAISHAAQLLQESEAIADTDRRLLDIILSHCQRMNGIVENVLGLARRERSRPERIDLTQWTLQTVADYRRGHFLEESTLRAQVPDRPLWSMFDPRQLQQVVAALVGNALIYGHDEHLPARIVVACGISASGAPTIEVLDHGPGVPDSLVGQIFEPFFTTSEIGSGLGLYVAKQICEANQATLSYSRVIGGGSCFRITLTNAGSLDLQPPRRPS